MGFLKQEYLSGLPFPSPGDLPGTGIEPQCPALQEDSLASESPGKPIRRWLRHWWHPHRKLTFIKKLISTRRETRSNKELSPLLWREERSRAQQGQNLERRGGEGQQEAGGSFLCSQKSTREQRGHRWWRQPRRSRIRPPPRPRDRVSPSLHAPPLPFLCSPRPSGGSPWVVGRCPSSRHPCPVPGHSRGSRRLPWVRAAHWPRWSRPMLAPVSTCCPWRAALVIRSGSDPRDPALPVLCTLHPRDLTFGFSLLVTPSFLSVSIADLPHLCLLPLDWQVSTATLGFSGGSAGKESTCHAGDLGSIPGLGRFPAEGKGYPLNILAWRTPWTLLAHGVAKSRIQLSYFHFHRL